ncbi:hypothetical protein A6D6_01865 [Alcanivorax xiamenensis]|uniref:DUF2971 domain-containing protein n=1 Tax=Alcanivorax xiamenensis TaxID=1177156 RepID=A0ABQ6Y8S7_9GAMM|nr:DUF2971 domain-containing protein [Alcanivorax xiamenensis]KAF0806047.1 hypothetical protein A6D6_01865 [Alcanivorax xiamenensis]
MEDIIYKYMEFREEFFDTRLLRFTPRLYLNDPFEVRPSFSEHAEYVHRVNGYGKSVNSVIEEMKRNQHLVLKGVAVQDFDIYGILSLTERNDNLLMWAHYAQDHSGMVIGFDPRHEFFDASKSSKKYVRNAVSEYIGVLKKVRYAKHRKSKGSSLDEYFFLKSNDWWTEREVRYVLPISEADEFRKNESGETLAFYQVPGDAIVSVIFGIRASEDNINRVKAKVRDSRIYRNVKLYQSKMCSEQYNLFIQPIDA